MKRDVSPKTEKYWGESGINQNYSNLRHIIDTLTHQIERDSKRISDYV